jgi:uncharacterized membrane protein YbaN (DUF454 family)
MRLPGGVLGLLLKALAIVVFLLGLLFACFFYTYYQVLEAEGVFETALTHLQRAQKAPREVSDSESASQVCF